MSGAVTEEMLNAAESWFDRYVEAMRRIVEQEAEIARLRLYIDGMHEKPGAPAHLYRAWCPYEAQPDARDPDCPACQLLADVPRGPAAL